MAKRGSSEFKDEAIAAVALWVDRTAAQANLSKSKLADKAGISDTTVTRGMAVNSEGTPKIENLHALARAAEVPSVLDFLEGRMAIQAPAKLSLPSVETLQVVLAEILASSANVELPESKSRPVASHLLLCLELLAKNPAIHDNPDALRAFAQAAIAQPPAARPEA